jgi:methionine-rich copper-binding protein CopC
MVKTTAPGRQRPGLEGATEEPIVSTNLHDLATGPRASRRRRLGALRLALATVLFAALLAPATVIGHAELDTVTPADKSTVQSPPTEIVMTFTEPVDPKKSSIKLVDAGGTVIDQGSIVDSANPKLMRLPIAGDLGPAAYTVRWTTASALDGDLDHGTTTFTVAAAPSVAPSPSANATSAPSASQSAVPPSAAPSPSPSSPSTTPATSTSDAVIPVVVALIVLAGLGLWLLRGRSRASR